MLSRKGAFSAHAKGLLESLSDEHIKTLKANGFKDE
jgi:hypothetical protein